MGFLGAENIVNNLVLIVPDAEIYHFGVLESNVHMAWLRAVCGRLEMRYRYSKEVVYNNFPWPNPTDEQKAKIEQTAQAILDARALYPDFLTGRPLRRTDNARRTPQSPSGQRPRCDAGLRLQCQDNDRITMRRRTLQTLPRNNEKVVTGGRYFKDWRLSQFATTSTINKTGVRRFERSRFNK